MASNAAGVLYTDWLVHQCRCTSVFRSKASPTLQATPEDYVSLILY